MINITILFISMIFRRRDIRRYILFFLIMSICSFLITLYYSSKEIKVCLDNKIKLINNLEYKQYFIRIKDYEDYKHYRDIGFKKYKKSNDLFIFCNNIFYTTKPNNENMSEGLKNILKILKIDSKKELKSNSNNEREIYLNVTNNYKKIDENEFKNILRPIKTSIVNCLEINYPKKAEKKIITKYNHNKKMATNLFERLNNRQGIEVSTTESYYSNIKYIFPIDIIEINLLAEYLDDEELYINCNKKKKFFVYKLNPKNLNNIFLKKEKAIFQKNCFYPKYMSIYDNGFLKNKKDPFKEINTLLKFLNFKIDKITINMNLFNELERYHRNGKTLFSYEKLINMQKKIITANNKYEFAVVKFVRIDIFISLLNMTIMYYLFFIYFRDEIIFMHMHTVDIFKIRDCFCYIICLCTLVVKSIVFCLLFEDKEYEICQSLKTILTIYCISNTISIITFFIFACVCFWQLTYGKDIIIAEFMDGK